MDRLLLSSSDNTIRQDLKNFLGKPVVLQSGVFSSSDTVSTFTPLLSPQTLLSSTVFADKVSGFFGFKGTLNLRITINATRFQQGRYMLTYVPLGGSKFSSVVQNDAGTAWYYAHTNSLYARTQLSRIELDLNCDTEGTITVPFSAIQNFFPIAGLNDSTNHYGTWGVFQIFPYVALQAGSGSTECRYTLYGWFTDVELIGAAAPQSGRMFTTSKKSKKISYRR